MIYVAYFMATLWTAGCFSLPLWVTLTLFEEGDKAGALAALCIGWPLGCLLGLLPWALIMEEESPDLATLKKAQWYCAQSHEETTTTFVMVGKVMVPHYNRRIVCDEYKRNK
jgi:hypothetical protein